MSGNHPQRIIFENCLRRRLPINSVVFTTNEVVDAVMLPGHDSGHSVNDGNELENIALQFETRIQALDSAML